LTGIQDTLLSVETVNMLYESKFWGHAFVKEKYRQILESGF